MDNAFRIYFCGMFILITSLFLASSSFAEASIPKLKDPIKSKGKNGFCINCHQDETPAIFEEWVKSPHARAEVGCVDCHGREKADSDAVHHFERFYISAIVTPFDCAKCHKDQLRDYITSGHAKSRHLLTKMKSDDPRHPVVSTFSSNNFSQCQGCHGATIKIDKNHRPSPETWPNSGAGRKNPDESNGTCNSCHLGHRFSLQAVRSPETCLRCHDGPNYPEGDIYRQSSHSVAYKTMAAGKDQEKPGIYLQGKDAIAPTCAYCHMNGAGLGLLNRHNPAWRLPRDLTSPAAPLAERSENLRQNMKSVCNQCHGKNFTDRFFSYADRKLIAYQKTVVEPGVTEYLKKLSTSKGAEREKLLKEYSDFLAEGKHFRMNLYMGNHGKIQR